MSGPYRTPEASEEAAAPEVDLHENGHVLPRGLIELGRVLAEIERQVTLPIVARAPV